MTDSQPQVPDMAEAPLGAPQVAEPGPLLEEVIPAAPRPGIHLGTGRRKAAVARVRLLPGSGNFLVNGRAVDSFFTEPQDRADAVAALEMTGVRRHWDVQVRVNGGGHTGQAGAIRLGVARALTTAYTNFEQALRDAGFLTRDARAVERKKYGRRKARRRFQFSKR